MDTKLCFNCYEKVEASAIKCASCGATFYDENQEEPPSGQTNLFQSNYQAEPNYEKELEKLEQSKHASEGDVELLIKRQERDLKWITIIASILGILQIYTSQILVSINTVATIFSSDTSIDGSYMVISGFIYFLGILLFYFRFKLARAFFLLGNIIHIFILYHVYSTLFTIRFRLQSEDTSDLPKDIQNFLDNTTIFMYLMFMFALFYVIHIFFMFKKELVNINVRR